MFRELRDAKPGKERNNGGKQSPCGRQRVDYRGDFHGIAAAMRYNSKLIAVDGEMTFSRGPPPGHPRLVAFLR